MKRIFLALIIALFSTSGFAAGGKQRLGSEAIDEVYQLCQQLGAEDGTITVEQCTSPTNCVVIKVDCSLSDED